MSIMTRAAAVAVVATLVVAGCGGGDDDDAGESGSPTTSATGTAGTGGADGSGASADAAEQAPATRPDVALEPVSDEWVAACETSDEMVDLAWQLEAGGDADPNGIAALMLALLDQVPPGSADDEVTWAEDLIAAFVGAEDISAYRADFQDNVTALLRAVGEGCGVDAGEPLPLPAGMVENLGMYLFDA
jgi:hypothetical protein